MRTKLIALSITLGVNFFTLSAHALEKEAIVANAAEISAVEKHNWSTSEREKKNKSKLTEFVKKNKMDKDDYSEVCAAFISSGEGADVSPPIRRHWLRKSPRQFSKPKYTKSASHLFGRTIKQHVCFTTSKHIRNGGSGESIKINSLKK